MKIAMGLLLVVLLVSCGGRREAEPTVVPVPTFTATPDLLETYRPAMIEQTSELGDGLHLISELLADPQFADDVWTVKLAGAIAQVKVASRTIAELSPPAILAEYHDAMVKASDTCTDFTDVLTEAIDNANTERLVEAGALLESCAGQINDSTALIPQ